MFLVSFELAKAIATYDVHIYIERLPKENEGRPILCFVMLMVIECIVYIYSYKLYECMHACLYIKTCSLGSTSLQYIHV